MTPQDAASKLAGLEDRLVTEAGPDFTLTAQTVEARRRVLQAQEWSRLALNRSEGEQARELGYALKYLKRALNGIERASQ